MTTYDFQSVLYPNPRSLCDGIASEWLHAGGLNDDADIASALEQYSDEELADEAIENWGLSIIDDEELRWAEVDEREPRTWMDEREIDRDMLVAAFDRFRDEFRITVDLINPWSGACVTRDISGLSQSELDAYTNIMAEDEVEEINYAMEFNCRPAEWLKAWVEKVGSERAGTIILGS